MDKASNAFRSPGYVRKYPQSLSSLGLQFAQFIVGHLSYLLLALMACRLRRQAAVNRAPPRRVSALRARIPHACARPLAWCFAPL